jgi:ribosomal protein L20
MALLTGYPGSPVSDVFEAVSSVADLLLEKGIVARMANNEALSAARLNGTTYSKLVSALKKANIELNRKMLADIAVRNPQAFAAVVAKTK